MGTHIPQEKDRFTPPEMGKKQGQNFQNQIYLWNMVGAFFVLSTKPGLKQHPAFFFVGGHNFGIEGVSPSISPPVPGFRSHPQ